MIGSFRKVTEFVLRSSDLPLRAYTDFTSVCTSASQISERCGVTMVAER
ncbi:hypothetical protein NXT3_PB00497 (plasmid) [Sinorhizobium fredii]|uniref:Uncharacterized protein n=1 Tax=Rhizobium fredii TaxID=380 RepID=A0A2L0HCB9_RHIFR|nr:hypothetical protein NXT3_PB00497 [Sinorhizobium fredii]